jgi:hypothetical protein
VAVPVVQSVVDLLAQLTIEPVAVEPATVVAPLMALPSDLLAGGASQFTPRPVRLPSDGDRDSTADTRAPRTASDLPVPDQQPQDTPVSPAAPTPAPATTPTPAGPSSPSAPSDGSRTGGVALLATLPAPPAQPALADLVSTAPVQTLQDGSDAEPSVSPA